MKNMMALAIQFIKFSMVGVVNTLFNYLCYSSFVLLGVHYVIANAIAWILGILLSYFLNSKFVFASKPDKIAAIKTYVVYGISFTFTTIGIALLVEMLHISEFLAPIIMLLFSVPFNFLAMKFWAMRKKFRIIGLKKCVVFDLDGTVFATHSGIFSSLQETLKANGYAVLPPDKLSMIIGPPIAETLRKEIGVEGEDLKRLVNEYREHYLQHGIYECEPFEGMKSLMESLVAKGCKLAIATYKRDDISKKLVKQMDFDKYFDMVCGLDAEGVNSKRQILQSILNNLDVKPEEAIMVGDSYYDYDAAVKCGCEFIGVTYGYGFSRQEIKSLKEISFVDNTKELARALKA